MATEVVYELGPSGNFATWQDARTALVALNPVANDQIVYLDVAVDVAIANNTSDWANANTDAEHPIIVRPKPGLGWRDINPGATSRPTTGIKLTITCGANNGLLVSNGFIFQDFLISATSTTVNRYPIFLGGTGTVRGGMRRCWIDGSNAVQPLITAQRSSAVPGAFADLFLEDCVVVATGSTTIPAATFSYNACVQRVLFAAPTLALRIAGAVGGPALRNCVVLGNVLNEHTGNMQALSIAASGSNYITGTYTRGGSGTSYTAGTFITGLTTGAFDTGTYRPASGGALIDTADDSANFTLDINLLNRSSAADVGPIQRSGGVSLPTGTVSAATPSGQSVTVSWTQTGATEGLLVLDGTADVTQAINTSNASGSHTFTGVAAGSYTVRLQLSNSGGPVEYTGGTVTITETGGSPEAPPPEEAEDPPVVSAVAGLPTGATAATIDADTTRSGGTLWAVVTTSATVPTKVQIKAGQNHLGAAVGTGRALSQSVGAPGTRSLSATNLTASQVNYAHVYHEHPDGDSNVASSAAFTQPAVVNPPAITDQPDNVTVGDGADATFSIAFTGTAPITVQARRDGANVPGVVVGSGTATYTVEDAGPDDNGAEITFFLENSADSVTSNAAVLTVDAPIVAPTIIAEPEDTAVIVGDTASFYVEASTGGGTRTYQWRVRPVGDSGAGTVISGATSALYSTAVLSLIQSGQQYQCQVSNESGVVVPTRWATVTVSEPEEPEEPEDPGTPSAMSVSDWYWTLRRRCAA